MLASRNASFRFLLHAQAQRAAKARISRMSTAPLIRFMSKASKLMDLPGSSSAAGVAQTLQVRNERLHFSLPINGVCGSGDFLVSVGVAQGL